MGLIGVILCFVYALIGFSGFVAFVVLKNYAGAYWALMTGILYAITLHLRWLKHKNRLDLWYSIHELRPLALMGFLALATGTAGFVYHLAIQIMSRTPIVPVDEDEVIPLVWAFMTLKAGAVLMWTARTYSLDDEERSSLVPAAEKAETPISAREEE